MFLESDFLDFMRCLNKAGVRYVLIGGYAAIINGVNRTTGDMDIFVERSEKNATKIVEAIADFGMGILGFVKEDFLDQNNIVQLGVSPIRIDILNDVPAISFEETWGNAINYTEEDVTFKVIHINQLIINKTAVGRGKDLEDVKALTKILNKKK
jgi:predicted nucleotidyltransferase